MRGQLSAIANRAAGQPAAGQLAAIVQRAVAQPAVLAEQAVKMASALKLPTPRSTLQEGAPPWEAFDPRMDAAQAASNLLAAADLPFVPRLKPQEMAPEEMPSLTHQLSEALISDKQALSALGLGISASMANLTQYTQLAANLHHVYSELEAALDRSTSPAVKYVWDTHGDALRRSERLAVDLRELGAWPPPNAKDSLETSAYTLAIRLAAQQDEATGGGRLLAHAHCRYLAELFGAQVLDSPYRYALGFARAPKHFGGEELYKPLMVAFDEAGDMLTPEEYEHAVAEAHHALQINVHLYQEGRPNQAELSFAHPTGVLAC